MNPVSPVPVPGWPEPARDVGAVPDDLAAMFAGMLAANVAPAPAPTSVPVIPTEAPVVTSEAAAVPCADGEPPRPSVAGPVPVPTPRATPTFPAVPAPDRPLHAPNGPATAGVAPTPAPHGRVLPEAAPAGSPGVAVESRLPARVNVGAHDAAPVRAESSPESAVPLADEGTVPEPTFESSVPERGRIELPADFVAVRLPASPALERAAAVLHRAAAAAAAVEAGLAGLPGPRLEVREGSVIVESVVVGDDRASVASDDVAPEAVLPERAVRAGMGAANASTDEHPVVAAHTHGRARSAASVKAKVEGEGSSAPSTLPNAVESAYGVERPVTPPHALVHGVTTAPARLEDPLPTVGGAQGPAPLPEERPQTSSPSHATVAFDRGDGIEGRLRVALRGDMLHASVQVPDAAAAERIERDLTGLTRALRAHGFEDARITVDVARTAASDRGQDSPSRDSRTAREHQQAHAHDRQPRRERGASREGR